MQEIIFKSRLTLTCPKDLFWEKTRARSNNCSGKLTQHQFSVFTHTHIPSKQKMKCKIQKFKDVKFIYFKYKLSLWLKMSHISDCVTHVYSLAIFLDRQVNSQYGLVVSLFIRILFRLLLKSFSRLISYAHCSLKNLLQSDLLSQW